MMFEKYKRWLAKLPLCVLIGITFPALAANSILQEATALLGPTTTVLVDAHNTMTTANAIYDDAAITLTNTNTLYISSLALVATLTTLNSIKQDTIATLTTCPLLYAETFATMTNANALVSDIYATMTTANTAYQDVHATYTTSTAILTDITATMTTLNPILTDAYATMTTLNAIYTDITSIEASESILARNATTLEYTATSILPDLLVANSYNLITLSATHSTLVNDMAIVQQTSLLAIPLTGTITEPGVYRLIGNVSETITIATSNVTLMLNGYAITSAGGDTIITTTNVENIYIAGGTIIADPAKAGILIQDNCANITIEHLKIQSGNWGIKTQDSCINIIVNDITISNCYTGIEFGSNNITPQVNHSIISTDVGLFQLSSTGILGDSLQDGGIVIYDDTIRGYATGIYIHDSQGSIIQNCSIGDTTTISATPTLAGIILENDSDSVITNCIIAEFSASTPGTISNAYGVYINNSPDSIISNCQILDISSTSLGGTTAQAYGIYVNNERAIDTINCLIKNISGDIACGFLSTGTSSVNVINTIAHHTAGTYAGATNANFSFQSTGTNYALRNISVSPIAPTVHFAGYVPNVTTGFTGSRVMNNFAIG